MKNNKLLVGIVGCGRISKIHLNAYKQISNIEVAALCDVNKDCFTNFKNIKTIKYFYTEYRELLNNKSIDIIDICSPSGLHAQMAIAAFKKNKYVLLEKPMALNLKDAREIIKVSKKTKKSFLVFLQNRYNYPIKLIDKNIKKLGKLLYINANVFWYRPQSYYEDGWHGSSNLDKGVLMNQGSHYADLVTYFANSKIKNISAFAVTSGHKMECEDSISVNILFQNGLLGNIQANTIAYPENFEGSLTLFFQKATIKIGGKSLNKVVYWNGVKPKNLKSSIEDSDNIYGNNHKYIIKNLRNHILKNEQLNISGKEAIKSLELICKAYESIDKKIII